MRHLTLSFCTLFILCFIAASAWADGQSKSPQVIEYDFDKESVAPLASPDKAAATGQTQTAPAAPQAEASAQVPAKGAAQPASTEAAVKPAASDEDLKKGKIVDGVITIIDDPSPVNDKLHDDELLDSLFGPAIEAQSEINLTPHKTEPTTKVPAKPGEALVELVEAPSTSNAGDIKTAEAKSARVVSSVSPERQFWAMASQNWKYQIKRYYTSNNTLADNRSVYAIDRVSFPGKKIFQNNVPPSYYRTQGAQSTLQDLSQFPHLR